MPSFGILLLTLVAFQPAASEGRTKVRLLYSFENPAEVTDLRRLAENVEFDVVADNGVTEGKNCCRVTFQAGSPYATFQLGTKASKGWKEFAYFAVDLYTDDEQEYAVNFELWDGQSRNYPTRFTQDLRTHKGRQTLLFPINRARRNGKEGRDWEELLPQDKIDLNGLTRVKLFLTPRKDRNAVFWIDNLRLLQEDAARPKMKVPLPTGALAFDFGSPGAVVPGFKNVAATTRYSDRAGYGFVDEAKRSHAGEGWPDLLTGTYVLAQPGQRLQFQARVPDGEYHVWLAAGPIIRPDLKAPHYYLSVGKQVLVDDSPNKKDFNSPKYLYRFLGTLYSQRPHALWHDYIDRMYPTWVQRVEVRGGLLTVEAETHFLGALILVPAAQSTEFVKLQQDLQAIRIKAFAQTYYAPPRPRAQAEPAAASFVVWQPHSLRTVLPWSVPGQQERQLGLKAVAAPGHRLVFRVAFTPWKDRGSCRLQLADLRSDSGEALPARTIRGYLQNYRSSGKEVSEMALLPRLEVESEPNLTWCFWLWQEIPPETKPGKYRGQHVFLTRHGEEVKIPVEIEVMPIQLQRALPLSLGMYFNEPHMPAPTAEQRQPLLTDLLSWMREVGFTGVSLHGPTVVAVGQDAVKLQFDPTLYEIARSVGMGRRPEQYSTGAALGIGRAIGRRLPGSLGAKVDQQPGLELRQPEFQRLFLNALSQYRAFIEKMKLPVAVEIVDEPREVPNPWNRNLADTILYAKFARIIGLTGFITPMSDRNGNKDYTVLADYAGILSVHGWAASAGLMQRARAQNTTLWLYNTGMDRFSWGFYNWKVGSKGRWEWHFSWPEDNAVGGYPGREWYNPFTAVHGLASQAPWPQYRGGILFQSAFLRVNEGITDSLYLHTLEETIKACKASGQQPKAVAQAEAFLAELRQAIPEFPEVKGLSGAGSGALVGEGINDLAAARASEWRERAARLIQKLQGR